jgi:hypothetical protein
MMPGPRTGVSPTARGDRPFRHRRLAKHRGIRGKRKEASGARTVLETGVESGDPLRLTGTHRRRATDRVSRKARTARVDASRRGLLSRCDVQWGNRWVLLQKRTSAFNSLNHSSDEFLQRRFRQRYSFLRPMQRTNFGTIRKIFTIPVQLETSSHHCNKQPPPRKEKQPLNSPSRITNAARPI